MGARHSKSDKAKPKQSTSDFTINSASVHASPECRALRCHSASLITAIPDPLDLSWKLFAKEIIEEATRDEADLPNQTVTKKSSILVSAVMRRVEARPSLFHRFVDVLKNNGDHILRELGGKLETTYNQSANCKQSTSDIKEQVSSTTKQLDSQPTPLTKQISSPPSLAAHSSHPSLLPPPPQSPVCRYANYLRAFYQTSELPAYNKWPRTPSTTFINLAVISREEVSSKDLEEFTLATLQGGVDEILRVKASIEIGDILSSQGKKLQCVLVEGAPGVGKTTLAWEICKQWGLGKLFQIFALVILLRLRDQQVQSAQSFSDLIFYQYQREEISHHLIHTDGKDTLIILEGLDELPRHLITQFSIFTHLLSGQVLPHATILVTSRPSATVQLWQNWEHRVSRHIEVLGFTQENVSQYIASVLPAQQLPEFQDYLSMNTHIKTTMYIPLHAAIVIEVYRWCQHPRMPLPKTITQLYTCLVHIILRRYLDNHPDYKEKETQFQTITDLPSPVYAHFYSLTQLAYTGVTQQKLIFQDQHQAIEHLGFMDAVTELFPTYDNQQVSYSYNFLHLSIQEYLAAYYISTMEIQEQEQLLGTMCVQTHLQNMAIFVAGITHFKDLDRAIVKQAIERGSMSREEGEEENKIKLPTHALQLLYECGNASILDSNQSYACPLKDHNPIFDFSTLGYCITHSNCKWRLKLGSIPFQFINSTERIEMLVQVLKNHTSPSYPYRIESIICTYDAPECVDQLLVGIPQNVLPHLQTLWLSSRNYKPLPQCVPKVTPAMNSLCTLVLYNTRGATAIHRTVQAVVNTNTLKDLVLSHCDIDCECVTTLCQWLSKSSQLETLELKPLPSPTAIERILTALTTANSTLKTLNLSQSKFNLQAGQAMYSMLTLNNTITEVRLWYCHIDDDIICCLSKGLNYNSTLTILSIRENSISDRGAESIAQILHSKNTLTTLNVSFNSVSDGGAESIAQALYNNSTLTTLDISWNSINDRGAVCIAKMLKINSTLQKVDLSYNRIGSEGRVSLEEVGKTNKYVKLHYSVARYFKLGMYS